MFWVVVFGVGWSGGVGMEVGGWAGAVMGGWVFVGGGRRGRLIALGGMEGAGVAKFGRVWMVCSFVIHMLLEVRGLASQPCILLFG